MDDSTDTVPALTADALVACARYEAARELYRIDATLEALADARHSNSGIVAQLTARRRELARTLGLEESRTH
jgi:hypothetical protein